MNKILDVVIYDDYNSRVPQDQKNIGTITLQTGNSSFRHSYKLIEIHTKEGTQNEQKWHKQMYSGLHSHRR